MLTTTQSASIRDIVSSTLERYGVDKSTATSAAIDISQGIKWLMTEVAETPRRKGTGTATSAGLNKAETIKAQLYEHFKINYPWHCKTGTMTLQYLMSRPTPQTVDDFAAWYWRSHWKGKKGQPPSLDDIYQNWPQAFETIQLPAQEPAGFEGLRAFMAAEA